MKTITEYQSDIGDLMRKNEDLNTILIHENRDPSNEELQIRNEIIDRIKKIRTIVDSMEREQNLKDELAKPAHAPIKPEVDLESRSAITMPDQNRRDSFGSFGEQLIAVMNAGLPERRVDPRLYQTRATGMGESIPSDGGFLVQTDFTAELLADVFATGRLASLCRKIQISGNANSIKINGVDETSRIAGSRQGGIRGYWKDEAAAKTQSKPKFRQITLELNKLIGLCYATDELLDDAAALEGIIRNGFNSEFGFMVDDAIINGSGAGQPLGILNAGSLVTQGKETGQAASTIVAQNVIKMWSRLFASSRPNAVWLINQNLEPQLHTMSIAVGTGGIPVYMPAGGLSALPYGTLFGRPVMAIEQCQTLGTLGDIYLGDFKNGYLLAEKGGVKADMSIHVQFLYDESVFRSRITGRSIEQSIDENSVNSGNTLASNVEGNPEPSPAMGRCNDYSLTEVHSSEWKRRASLNIEASLGMVI